MSQHPVSVPSAQPQGAACSLVLNQQNIYKVARALKKDEHTLFNCLASIVGDSHFVQEIRLLYPDLPLLANLRAGGWYAPSPDGTCYFKSTDGHQNNCNFSVTRLNWHVAELATQRGGVIIVDATRKGKRFPDAMSKTIPIWAAVLNRAVARVRAYDAQKAQRRLTYAAADGEVFTAVADTQTTISVRSGQACAASSSSDSSSTGGLPCCLEAGVVPTDSRDHQPQHMVELSSSNQQGLQQSQGQSQQGLNEQQTKLGVMQPQGSSRQHTQHQRPMQQQCSATCISSSMACTDEGNCTAYTSSNAQVVVDLLVDCMGPSMDLMAAGIDCTLDSSPPGAAACCTHSPAAVPTPQPCGATSQQCSAALTAGAGPAPSCCCSLHRSKSVHISPQPSLHEWLDEMDVLRRLTLLADSRAAGRTSPRMSCPTGCSCTGRTDCLQRPQSAATTRGPTCAASAPAVSCLLDEDDSAPATPAAGGCLHTHFGADSLALREQSCRAKAIGVVVGPADATALQPATAGECDSAPLLSSEKATARPFLEAIGSPAFLLGGSGKAGSGLETESTGEPATPRLVFVHSSDGSSSRSRTTTSSASDASSGSSDEGEDQQGGMQRPAAPASTVMVKQLRFVEPQPSQRQDIKAAVGADFAFPPPHQLAASAGSSVGAEAAGHLAASGLPSSGSSCGSELVRLPDMPVVVLNGTSHQPGDAASILDIWRGTDLEDVACLPAISDFRPGVYHLPAGEKQQQVLRQGSIDDEGDWSAAQQQQQEVPQRMTTVWNNIVGNDNSSSSSRNQQGTSWAAEVCIRSQQQLSGRLSISNWLDDDETSAAREALCAFAVPALSPSCGSTVGSSDETEAAASCCSLACCSQGSGSVCSEDSQHSSKQTDGPSSSAAGGRLAASGSLSSVTTAPIEWDTSLHLPLWVSTQEREAIEAKLDGWVERLLEVGADVRSLAAVLTKPLRPLWVSQSSLIWTNQVAHPSTLPFTPLLLVSASQPSGGERQALRSAWLSLAKGAGARPERPLSPPGVLGSCSSNSSDDCSSDEDDWDSMNHVGSCGSSGNNRGKGWLKHRHKASSKQPGRHAKGPGSNSSVGKTDVGTWSFVYVPGAGDDEESWAAGLTPALFWQHCDALLQCGPSNIKSAVKQLMQLHKSASYSGAAASLAAAAVRSLATDPHTSSDARPGRPWSPLGPHGSLTNSLRASGGVATDTHHPAPQGCAQVPAQHVAPAAPGAFWLGTTGLAVGSLEGASSADVWRTFDAVLCCGTALLPLLQGEYQAMKLAAEQVPAAPAVATAVSSSAPCSSWMQQQQQQQPQQVQAGRSERQVSSSVCNSSSAAHNHWLRQQQVAASLSADSTAGVDQVAQQRPLEFSKVSSSAAKKPVRKNGMLSALLSKAIATGGAAAAVVGCSSSSSSCCAVDDPGGAAADVSPAGSDASSSAVGSAGSSRCSSSFYSVCSDEGSLAGLYDGGGSGRTTSSCSRPQLPRLKWLPVESAKRDRASLKHHLQEALEFVSAHLAAGHTVLLHDVEGYNTCVCLAVAVLSGCFAATAAGETQTAQPSFVAAWPAKVPVLQQQPPLQQPGVEQQQDYSLLLPPAPVSKQSVRQQLALVSSCYPLARPTRGMLKQVFNFFEECRRGAAP